jgi:predicted nucleic acid-binding Zn ribbon protein
MYRNSRLSGQRKKRGQQPKPIGGVIENVVRSLGISRSYHGWLVVSRWPDIVGEHIAKASRAFRFEEGTLYVAVPEASWRNELSLQIEDILKKIHSYPFGRVVKELRLVQGEKG